MRKIQPVILAGGDGERKHPLSGPKTPQQFLGILEEDSPFQDALERVSDLAFLPPLVVTTPGLVELVMDQCDEIAFEEPEILVLEAVAQDPATYQAIVNWARDKNEDFALLICPADHFVADQGAFLRAVEDGVRTAGRGYLVTFGVVADFAQAGCDYIAIGPRLDAGYSGHQVERFVCNADVGDAQKLLATGRFVRHSGIICATPQMLANDLSLQKHERLCVVSLLSAWADLSNWPGIWKALSLI